MTISPFPAKPEDGSDQPAVADELLNSLAAAVVALLGSRPEDIQREILRRAAKAIPAPSVVKSGNVLGTVTSIFARSERKNWNLAEIKTAVAAEGLEASDKQISNSLAYLTRRGRLEQVAYGRYLNRDIGGVLLTTEPLNAAPSRFSESDE
jgi:hypothetical protein